MLLAALYRLLGDLLAFVGPIFIEHIVNFAYDVVQRESFANTTTKQVRCGMRSNVWWQVPCEIELEVELRGYIQIPTQILVPAPKQNPDVKIIIIMIVGSYSTLF